MRSSSGAVSRSRRTAPKADDTSEPTTETTETTETTSRERNGAAPTAESQGTESRHAPRLSAQLPPLPEETPPPPAQVSQAEANQADAEKDLARAERPKRRSLPGEERKQERKKALSKKFKGNIVVVSTRPTVYVDEEGNRLPDIGEDALLPIVMIGSRVVEGMGMRPFDDAETKTLATAWAPIAQKYAGWLMPFLPEAMAFGTLLTIMWPRVRELDEKRKRERAMANVPKNANAPQVNGGESRPGSGPQGVR